MQNASIKRSTLYLSSLVKNRRGANSYCRRHFSCISFDSPCR